MGDFFKFVLNSDLELKYLVTVLWVFDLLRHLLCLSVETGLIERLSVVESVGVYFWEKLGQLIVHVCRLSVILDVVIAMPKQR